MRRVRLLLSNHRSLPQAAAAVGAAAEAAIEAARIDHWLLRFHSQLWFDPAWVEHTRCYLLLDTSIGSIISAHTSTYE